MAFTRICGEMLAVDGQIVTCEGVPSLGGLRSVPIREPAADVDWNAAVSEGGITYGDYVKLEAVNAAKRFVVTRAWAEQAASSSPTATWPPWLLQRQELVSFLRRGGLISSSWP